MKTNAWLLRPMVLAVSSCFGVPASANPTVPQVVQGTVGFQGLNSNNVTVTNSPGAVINWQTFSIGAGQSTRFVQESASSSVLNRVIGVDIGQALRQIIPSKIDGLLQSNGRVFLINTAGIIVGAGGVIDTAGFVGSTLNMLDADFLAGKLKFQGDANSGSIVNNGAIRSSYGGSVVLIAPHIENSKDSIIEAPGGQVLLAAGQKVTIASLDPNGVQFELQAPTDSVLNLGSLIAQGGAVGVFAGTLKHSGDIRADALVRDEGGRIVLKAQTDLTVASGSTTSANGKTGGDVLVQSAGRTNVAGNVSATGADGRGGDVKVLGDEVAVSGGAVLDASGAKGGGRIRVGGDYQGANASIQNAVTTTIDRGAKLSADALDAGNGGRIIVWADKSTRFEGALSARGGERGGNGGFAEVSGKEHLFFGGTADLGAANGYKLGDLLLDPLDAYVFAGGGLISQLVDEAGDFPATAITVTPDTLAAVNGNVTISAGRYLRINDPIALTTQGQSFTAQVGTFTPGELPGSVPNRLDIAANISTTRGAVTLSAPAIQSFGARTITTQGGAVALNAADAIQAGGVSIDASATGGPGGAVTAASGTALQLGAVSGSSFGATSTGFMQIVGAITTSGGPVTLTTLAAPPASNSLSAQAITTNGGAVTLTASNASVSAGAVSAGSGAVSMTGSSVSDFAGIDTTGNVVLNATAGSILATVNNAASVNATATSTIGAGISLFSTTALNATNVVASSPACVNTCFARVFLNVAGDVNVGTVRATGTSFSNDAADAVTIISTGGSIRGTSGALVTATDVSLSTGPGTGGGIFGAPTLNVNARRNFEFNPNGAFDVNLTGAGPNIVAINLGAAAAASAYSGRLRSSGGTVTLDATADPTTVTVSNFAVTGFNDRAFNTDPLIWLNVPDGNLVASTISVPQGDTRPATPGFTPANLPVSISASGNVTVENYVRAGGGLAKSTSFSSATGSVTLGSVNASRDSVVVNASTHAAISALSTAGSVLVNAFSGNIDVGRIDTTSGVGSVSLFASNGAVRAATDSVALEVLSGSSVDVSAGTVGNNAFANPLDVAGSSVSLTGVAGPIGFAGRPVVANTDNLFINAASGFNVSTGPVALRNLTVFADPTGVGAGGFAQVRTEVGQPNDKTYVFASDGANFSFAPGTVPATQFSGGLLDFIATGGNVSVGSTNFGAGSLAVRALNGSINTGTFDGAGLTLTAGTSTDSAAAVSITTGVIGATVRPATVSMTAGNAGGGVVSGRSGSIETRAINAETVDLSSFAGSIRIGAAGTDDIGSAITRAGAVTLTSSAVAGIGGSGEIRVGNVFTGSVAATTFDQAVIAGNLNATDGINLVSNLAVTTGTLDASHIRVTNDGTISAPFPQITVGAVGGLLAPTSLALHGQAPAGGVAIQTLGPVTGADGSTLDLIAFRDGAVILGGPVVAGAGSNIFVSHRGAAPFRFGTLNAGADGSVRIESFNAIEQTADGLGNGITAANVNLFSSTGAMTNTADPAQRIDLNTVKNLVVDGSGTMRFDVHGNTLSAVRITKNTGVDVNPFELANLAAGQVIALTSTPSDLALAVQSTTPLDFNLAYNAGSITIPGAIVTSGGALDLNASGALNGSAGSITTAGGAVTLRSRGGNLNTGAINSTGGSINASAACVGCDLVVDGNVNAGAGSVTLFGGRSITRTGPVMVTASSVDFFASDGDIGTLAIPLLITTPQATLNARDFTGGTGGFVFADLTGTSSLNLTGDNGFNVTSSAALQSLTLTTRGTGTGIGDDISLPHTLNLAAAGQTYAFSRPSTDLFGVDITNAGATRTFRIDNASGPGLATATFQTSDGDLMVAGAATLSAPDLTLRTLGTTGDLKLQGTTANPLALSQASQSFSAGRDLLVTGNVALSASGRQALFAQRDLTVQARSGSVAFTASDQDISTRTGSMSFIGGAAADETVTVTASTRQLISTRENGGGNVLFRAGAGDRANVSVVYTGPNVANVFEQRIEVGGNIRIEGGAGINSDVTIATATGDQVLRAGNTADPSNVAIGNIFVTGGGGPGSDARVTNSGPGIQRVGESTCNTGVQGCPDFPYQTRDITVMGGGGAGSVAAITSAGSQQIYSRGGALLVRGGAGPNATATIESTSTTEQHIGLPTYLGEGRNRLGSVAIKGGTGAGAAALIITPAFQRVTAIGGLSLTGNPTGTSAPATLSGAGQDVRVNTITLAGGAADSRAQVTSSGTQTFCGSGYSGATCTATSTAFSALTMTGGTGANAFAGIDAAGAQTLRGGNLTLTGGGTGVSDAQRIANAGAVIQGHSQTIAASTVAMTGGAGRPGATSDALMRNLSGSQQVTAESILLTGGHEQSMTGIINQGAGTQSVAGFFGVTMRSNLANAPAQSAARVAIHNTTGSQQTITSIFGGISLQNSAADTGSPVEINSAGAQTISSRFVDVTTAAGATSTGTARIVATGNQWINTTGGGIQVAALGSGEAAITSGATQLLEVDYPAFMQGTGPTGQLNVGRVTQRFAPADAAGTSRIEATGDQTIFAGGVLVKGPTGDGKMSKLSAAVKQTISTLLSGLQVTGGSGAGSLATVDPTTQTIVSNGGFNVLGGTGAGATALISSQGVQQLVATNSSMLVSGGAGDGAHGVVQTTAPAAQLISSGLITPTAGSGLDADGLFVTGFGGTPGTFTVSCGAGCVIPTLFSSDPRGNGVSDAGAVASSWNVIPFSALTAAAASTTGAPDAGNVVPTEHERMLSSLPGDGAFLDSEARRRQFQQCN